MPAEAGTGIEGWRRFCTQCGLGVGCDEDGCCAMCGLDTCDLDELKAYLAAHTLYIVNAKDKAVLDAIDAVTPGDLPNFHPGRAGMDAVYVAAFARRKAASNRILTAAQRAVQDAMASIPEASIREWRRHVSDEGAKKLLDAEIARRELFEGGDGNTP